MCGPSLYPPRGGEGLALNPKSRLEGPKSCYRFTPHVSRLTTHDYPCLATGVLFRVRARTHGVDKPPPIHRCLGNTAAIDSIEADQAKHPEFVQNSRHRTIKVLQRGRGVSGFLAAVGSKNALSGFSSSSMWMTQWAQNQQRISHGKISPK
jgi:hypothetical protein